MVKLFSFFLEHTIPDLLFILSEINKWHYHLFPPQSVLTTVSVLKYCLDIPYKLPQTLQIFEITVFFIG